MKQPILSCSLAGLLAATACAAEKTEKTNSSNSSASSAVSVATVGGNGTATVTIEVNGKKETRTFNLGDQQPFTLKLQDGKVVESPAGKKETWLGVAVGGAPSEEVRAQLPIAEGEGVTVSHVAPDSPAGKAGLQQHDILVRFDEQILVSPDQFRKLVKMKKPGDTVKLGFFRKGERNDIEVVLGEHEATPEPADVLKLIGQPGKWKDLKIEDLQQQFPNAGKLQEALKERTEAMREKLKEAKEKYPGIIVDSKAFLLNPDGTIKKLEDGVQNIEKQLREMVEQLEKSDIPKETVEQVRRNIEKAIETAGEAAKRNIDEVLREIRSKKEPGGKVEIEKGEPQSAPNANPPANPPSATPPTPR
jgi:membrane-associated protease RseP (regulator of RpoE activity)